jgi:anti-sigma regulatory factor (Ser/Thr protein kinase)
VSARMIRVMLEKIQEFVSLNPGLKAKTIARHLGLERQALNRLLHENGAIFQQDQECGWLLTSPIELRVDFGGKLWLDAKDVERLLRAAGSPLDSDCGRVLFSLQKDTHMMLEALARLLALSNQLSQAGKAVTLDFSDAKRTLTYLDRLGFFDHLDSPIHVLPKRPVRGRSREFRGNNDGLIEFRAIDPTLEDGDIPKLLEQSFVRCAGDSYSVAVMTILSELYSNVLEHSKATTPGFAGLQSYKTTRHIQAVISDSGKGIVGTLEPVLRRRYPKLAEKVATSKEHAGVVLLKEVFSAGRISQMEEEGRGLGLKRSGDFAKKFRARISIRQRDFELSIYHSQGRVSFRHSTDLVRIEGTHICFDFLLDAPKSPL